MSVYGKYSMRGHVERQIQYEATLNAVFVLRHAQSAVFFIHTSLEGALTFARFSRRRGADCGAR